MCILCLIQRWSRGVATMLPWLVIPLIGLWALSQLLPPAFRFEITSPRFACVMVLLFTLMWYEVLMPWLSAWRVRRNARLTERKRIAAFELHKWRKIAVRRCRNCLTPYRDQNPGGGKFMCLYCGHVSKRPVLDLPVQPGLRLLNSGILKDLVGKGGNILNGKVWSDNSWMCGHDTLDNGNWIGGSFVGKASSWSKNGSGFSVREHCLAEKSYSPVFILACKVLTDCFSSILWVCSSVFRISSSRDDDASLTVEQRAMLDKRGENGGNCQESRSEKARRKAEEKRQARLEKELLEEEDRKQREEVARLVEERRKLREEHMEVEKERGKVSAYNKIRDNKREAEKRRQEKRNERDRGSSKSNSDTEELDKRIGKGNERKWDLSDRRQQHQNWRETVKTHSSDAIHGSKGASATTSNHNRGNVGARYFDSMRGSILSSSRAFTGGNIFRKTNSTSTVPREHKSNTGVDHIQTHASRRDLSQLDTVSAKLNANGDDRSINRPVLVEPQPFTTPKKSWQQLFTRSSAVSRPTSNVICRPCVKPQAEVQGSTYPRQPPSTQSFDNPISFGLPSPFPLSTFSFGPTSNVTSLPLSSEALFPLVGDGAGQLLPEESEIFEDPCYVPDPVSLLGPVSESLDNFQLDLGVMSNVGFDKPCPVKNVNVSSEVTRRSPIESPRSRLCVPEERHGESFLFPSTLKAHDVQTVPMNVSSNANDMGTWQMWNSSPLGRDGLSLIVTPCNWLLNPERNRSKMEEIIPPAPPKSMASLFKNDDQVLSVSHCPQAVYAGSFQNNATLSANRPSSAENGFRKAPFGTYSSGESQFSLNPENVGQSEFESPNASVTRHPFGLSPPDCWAKKDLSQHGSGEGVGNLRLTRAPIGGLYYMPDVQSLWS